MENAGKGEKSEKEALPLQIDSKCFQDALRKFFPPIKNDDPRLDFYAIYKKEATEYDTEYVKKYDEDLNTTLIFAGLFSAVSSAFVIDVHSRLEPDPNEQSAALLRAILLTLNHSAIPGETLSIPPAQGNPPNKVVTVTGLMYASLFMSLLAAFIAMLGKQWLNHYLRNMGGSMIERCGDRQRKHDGLKRWPFHLFVESLPVILQISLLLLACGLCRHMASINTSVASVLITLTVLGVLFYLGIVIVGTASYECPFQTPVSVGLRSLWEKFGHHITAVLLPVVTAGTSLYKCLPWPLVLTALHNMWEFILCHTLYLLLWFPLLRRHPHPQSGSLPIAHPNPQECTSLLAPLYSLWENIQCKIFRMALHLPQAPPPLPSQASSSNTTAPSPWLTPTTLAKLQKTNANDVRCVSWILWNITDPEALDSAIRLASTIRWFEDGDNTVPPYDLIVSTLEACFDSKGKIYPGLRDRAYSSAQATLWIHIRAMHVSEEFAFKYPLPAIYCHLGSLDHDLCNLLEAYQDVPGMIAQMHATTSLRDFTPTHMQWISNALLHLSWAKRGVPSIFNIIHTNWGANFRGVIAANTLLNRILVSCILLGQPIDDGALMIHDKSYAIFSLSLSAA